jgi:hypothetical protein
MDRQCLLLHQEHINGTDLPHFGASAIFKQKRGPKWHGSKFSPTQYQLVHFTRSKTKFNTTKSVNIGNIEVKSSQTATYLGLTLDSALRWEEQTKHIQRKVANLPGTSGNAGGNNVGSRPDAAP